jgi:hypothetical protein
MVIPKNATAIPTTSSEMDSSNPFFLHHGDSLGTMSVSTPLNGDNYNSWKRAMVMVLSRVG